MSKSSSGVLAGYAVAAALLVVLIMNGLASALPLGGRTTGELSDSFPILITPAGYIFSIWGLIYLGLIAFAIYQCLPAVRDQPGLAAIRMPFIASCVFNVAWILAWHYSYVLASFVIMLGLLASLVVIYTRIRAVESPGWSVSLLVKTPFSIYLAWICVATVVNASVALYSIEWGAWGVSDEIWGAIAVALAILLTVILTFSFRDLVFPLVILWALVGIYHEHSAVRPVALTAVLGISVILLTIVAVIFAIRSGPGKVSAL